MIWVKMGLNGFQEHLAQVQYHPPPPHPPSCKALLLIDSYFAPKKVTVNQCISHHFLLQGRTNTLDPGTG